MAYTTYTTKALVCGTWDRNTSDKSYLLFTREAGMLYADARSARLEKSKQRYALQDFSLIRVSLVKGKGGWRAASVEPIQNHYQMAVNKAARGSVVKVYRTLRRFFSGEEASVQLFDQIVTDVEVLTGEVADRTGLESVVEVRILYALGYVDKKRLPHIAQAPVQADSIVEPAILNEIASLLERAVSSSQL
jgi:recombinational DNA repair protein (RecF pathway)